MSKYASIKETVSWVRGLIEAVHRDEIHIDVITGQLSPTALNMEKNLDDITKKLETKLYNIIESDKSADLKDVLGEVLFELGLPNYPISHIQSGKVEHNYAEGFLRNIGSVEYASFGYVKNASREGAIWDEDADVVKKLLEFSQPKKATPQKESVGKTVFASKQSKKDRIIKAIKNPFRNR